MHADRELSAEDLERFRARLLAERERVLSEINFTEEEIEELQRQEAAERQDASLGGSGSFTFDREVDRALDENAERVLGAVEEALKRIDAGTFGICTNCGKPISSGRLEARPYADRCIDCA